MRSAGLDLDHALAADANALGRLKAQAGARSPQAIREAARQFESLFMRELIKSMREATMKSGLLDSPTSDLGTDLLDQQFALSMSGAKGGLSDLIAAQLARQMGVEWPATSQTIPATAPAAPAPGSPRPETAAPASALQRAASLASYQQHNPGAASPAQAFVSQHTPVAQRVAEDCGLPASYLIGQAGHETGWGQREICHADGSPSYNLFGIKADASWRGKVAEVLTTEVVGGVAQQQRARFRAYDSYDASFRDYARLITQSPRYSQAKGQTGSASDFARSLQQAGYATDPHYASKVSRAIHTAQRLQGEVHRMQGAS